MTNAVAGLPQWSLQDLYDSPDAENLQTDLDEAERRSTVFAANYAGQLNSLDGAGLTAAIIEYESILENLYRAMSYAQLLHAVSVTNPDIARFYQSTHERVTAITATTLFFTLELNHLEDEHLKSCLENKNLSPYQPWLNEVRQGKPYQLSDDVERILHEKSVTGRHAWVRLFDETMAHLKFSVGDKVLSLTETLDCLTDNDTNQRQDAGQALVIGLKSKARTLTTITNVLAKDKEIEDRWRGYASPASMRHLNNQVEPQVVEALVSAVKNKYSNLAHRYYRLKAVWMGQKRLNWWDRNAPLPDDAGGMYEWQKARELVLGAFGGFTPQMADLADIFFEKNWIDALPRAGKGAGAFAHPTVPSAHPYIMLNYHGKPRDVMTLAHELGHGVHQVLAGPQGLLLSNTPLTLAETASVFGEMLTFRALLDKESDVVSRRVLLAGKVEDMLNTVVRQVAFHEFEVRVHAARKTGELSAESLSQIWVQTQQESLGPIFNLNNGYEWLWGYIPHFIHSPFYVYAYAFGDCLVNALYGVFKDGHPGFQEKYLDMLRAGGSKRHRELLEPFGLDASEPAFWSRGLRVISDFIDELEEAL
ncbi:MAG: oligoendopeptidase F [Rhodospirillaceae bacterium TMED8]|nr:oligoendopeptidase F [Magnetovibrio sp.]OUT50281.1 MAG: oligoendopeptidase F [Rhodospirillaceae bacterium TMED8]|tara:strand:- start:647 stop:2419 length:1773 start_codon:yes stop_codon:yes gene_type:complete